MAFTLELTRKYTSYTDFVYQDTSEWGVGSNPIIGDIDTATLTITGVGFSYSKVTDVTADYIVNNPTFTVAYNTNGSVIPDGVYKATLDITMTSGVPYEVELDTGSYFEVQAAVYKRISRIPEFFKCNDCCNQFIKETLCMKMLLDALVVAAMYSTMTEFSDILETLTAMTNYDTTYELT